MDPVNLSISGYDLDEGEPNEQEPPHRQDGLQCSIAYHISSMPIQLKVAFALISAVLSCDFVGQQADHNFMLGGVDGVLRRSRCR